MKRRLPTILTFVCFILFMLLLVLWVRSHCGLDSLVFRQGSWGRRVYRVNSIAGYVQGVADDSSPAGTPVRLGFYRSLGPVTPLWRPASIPAFWCGTMTEQVGVLGFQWDVYRGRSPVSNFADVGAVNPAVRPILARRLAIPYWFPLALAGPGAFLWLRGCWNSRESAHWVREGHCRHCGYDLRATPDRCPECGTPAGVTEAKA